MDEEGRGGQGMRAGTQKEEEVVSRRGFPTTKYQIGEGVFDSTPPRPRFERCWELQGKRRQMLLRRVEQEGEEEAQDLEVMAQLRDCPYILSYCCSWVTTNEVLYMLCEDARMFLSVCLQGMRREEALSTHLFTRWLYQLASALMYLHENNPDQPVLHRNLQPDNIMITDTCDLKVCAFGTSKRLDRGRNSTGTTVGVGLFQSPEIARRKSYDQSTDIWSWGVTAVYIANYSQAKKAGSADRLLEIMQESNQGEHTQKAVKRALQTEAAQRPKASHIVRFLWERYGAACLTDPVPATLFPSPLVLSSRRPPPPQQHQKQTGNQSSNPGGPIIPPNLGPSQPSKSRPWVCTVPSAKNPEHSLRYSNKCVDPNRKRMVTEVERTRQNEERVVGTAEMATQTSIKFTSTDTNPELHNTGTQTLRTPSMITQPSKRTTSYPIVIIIQNTRQRQVDNNDRDHSDQNSTSGRRHRQPIVIDARHFPTKSALSTKSGLPSGECTTASDPSSSPMATTASDMTVTSSTSSGTMMSVSVTSEESVHSDRRPTVLEEDLPPPPCNDHCHQNHTETGPRRHGLMCPEVLQKIDEILEQRHQRHQGHDNHRRQQQQPRRRSSAPRYQHTSEEGSGRVDQRLARSGDRRLPQSSQLPQDRGSRQRRARSSSRRYHGDTDTTSGLGDSPNE